MCCIQETGSVIRLIASFRLSVKLYLHLYGDPEVAASALADVGVGFSERAEAILRDRIPVGSQLCSET